MAYKNYKIKDNWLDIDKYNVVDVQSIDGVIQGVKVNGEDAGGGGGGYDTAVAVYANTQVANAEYTLDGKEWYGKSFYRGDGVVYRCMKNTFQINIPKTFFGTTIAVTCTPDNSANIDYETYTPIIVCKPVLPECFLIITAQVDE